MNLNINDIKNIESEAGIIATILNKPDYIFYSEQLRPNHFADHENAYIYYAIRELAQHGIEKVDAYNIINVLNAKESTKKQAEKITIESLNELIDISKLIVRDTIEEYKLLVDNVLDKAFRRETYKKLTDCERLCFNSDETEIQQKIYSVLDEAMMDFSTTSSVPQYKDIIRNTWKRIKDKQIESNTNILFKYPTLNKYVTIDPAELVIFGADTKVGKSILLLNCTVDLLKKKKSVLYIDSELNTEMFTVRLIAHLCQIEHNKVKTGHYNEDEGLRIEKCLDWLETCNFTHLYMPLFDSQTIYTAVKKTKHTQGLDVLIVDYFKSKGDGDAFNTYQEMGKLVDLVKNKICGDMGIAGIGAAQADENGRLADSKKIARNASTIIILERKKPDEIERDGIECGNSKMRVILNRNGEQMSSDEYIDLHFNGNLILYKEAKQHVRAEPY